MRSFYASLLTALFLFVPAGASHAADSAPSGGISIRLMDIPEATQTDPRARSYIVDNLPPGSTIERRVEVQNTTPDRQSVAVYASAAEDRKSTRLNSSHWE